MGSRLDLGTNSAIGVRAGDYSFLHLDIATSRYLCARQFFFRLQPTHGITRTMTHARDSTSESEDEERKKTLDF